MKCPKCQYISFDSAERCRNCGFEFALAAPPAAPADLALTPDGAIEGPPRDFTLRGATPMPSPAGVGRPGARAGRGHTPASLDLPLFEAPVPGVDDTPLIKTPATPRPPLAVRRQAPDVARRVPAPEPAREPEPAEFLYADREPAVAPPAREPREPHETAPADRPHARVPSASPAVAAHVATQASAAGAPRLDAAAPVGRRVWAAVVDGAILLGIDAVVVYLTLQLTGVAWREWFRLPLLPLLGFLALLNGGYLVSFTVAQGQTIGKVLAGIRVVSNVGTRVPLASAVLRAGASVISVLPLGIGCVPVLMSGDRLTLHDRLSGTRVVRA